MIIKIVHIVSVVLFLLLYFIKTILLLSNKEDILKRFTAITKVPEMIISALFLFTGGYLLTQVDINSLMVIKIILVLGSIPMAVIGFKKKNKILASLSLLLITASYGLAEMSAKKRKSGSDAKITVESKTAEIYNGKCASCHGADGKLGFDGAANLSTTLLQVEQIKQVVLQGKGAMSKVELSEAQADSVASYVFNTIKGK